MFSETYVNFKIIYYKSSINLINLNNVHNKLNEDFFCIFGLLDMVHHASELYLFKQHNGFYNDRGKY